TIGEKVEDATHVAHLSVPPNVFKDIIVNLSDIRDTHDEDIRLVVEKPFGYDESSAEQLYHVLGSNFSEDQVFLLDHYLGKNTMQSIFELRKSNRILSTILRGQEISNIQITIHENYGADQRLGYFEQVGIIRDMVQSHMFQMLALVTMSIPVSDSARQIRIEKDTILSALRFYPDKSNIVIGQYESYAGQKDTDPHTQATTYAALRLFIDRQDWYKVPIYLRVGKKLDTTKTTIIVEFEKFAFQNENDPPNRLVFHMKPTQEVEVQFVDASHSEESKMVLGKSLACMDDVCLNEHGQLLYEVMQNNQKNFVSFEEIIASWRIVDSIIEFIAKEKIPPSLYKDNSQGPEGYEQLPNQDNFSWYDA
ncbi:hypothetical protein KC717_00475, partial [Candidatus Dojkabacteria bacterium]|nr:hypothetical protein [Candidatus Dojkabacteria bacterium]